MPTCTFRLAEVETQCSTRERGRRVYLSLLTAFRTCADRQETFVIAFDGVELVTPSFLDETILRLVREEPRGEVTLSGIRDFPVQSLARMLVATGVEVEIRREAEGVYHVTA